MVFRWSLSNSTSPQVSWTLLSIRADLNKAVVLIVSTRPIIFISSTLSTIHFVTVLSAPITTAINVTFRFNILFCSQAKSRYLSPFLLSGLPCGQLKQQSPQLGSQLKSQIVLFDSSMTLYQVQHSGPDWSWD